MGSNMVIDSGTLFSIPFLANILNEFFDGFKTLLCNIPLLDPLIELIRKTGRYFKNILEYLIRVFYSNPDNHELQTIFRMFESKTDPPFTIRTNVWGQLRQIYITIKSNRNRINTIIICSRFTDSGDHGKVYCFQYHSKLTNVYNYMIDDSVYPDNPVRVIAKIPEADKPPNDKIILMWDKDLPQIKHSFLNTFISEVASDNASLSDEDLFIKVIHRNQEYCKYISENLLEPPAAAAAPPVAAAAAPPAAAASAEAAAIGGAAAAAAGAAAAQAAQAVPRALAAANLCENDIASLQKGNFVSIFACNKIWKTEYQKHNSDIDKIMCKLYSIHGDTPLREILNCENLWFFFNGDQKLSSIIKFSIVFSRVEYSDSHPGYHIGPLHNTILRTSHCKDISYGKEYIFKKIRRLAAREDTNGVSYQSLCGHYFWPKIPDNPDNMGEWDTFFTNMINKHREFQKLFEDDRNVLIEGGEIPIWDTNTTDLWSKMVTPTDLWRNFSWDFWEAIAVNCWKRNGQYYHPQNGLQIIALNPKRVLGKSQYVFKTGYSMLADPYYRNGTTRYTLRDAWLLFLRFYTSVCSLISTETLRKYILQYGNNTLNTFRYFSNDGGSISGYELRPQQYYLSSTEFDKGVLFRGSDNLNELDEANGWIDCGPYSTSWCYEKAIDFTKVLEDITRNGTLYIIADIHGLSFIPLTKHKTSFFDEREVLFFGPLHVIDCQRQPHGGSVYPRPARGEYPYNNYFAPRHNNLYNRMYNVLSGYLSRGGGHIHQIQIRVIELRSPKEHITMNRNRNRNRNVHPRGPRDKTGIHSKIARPGGIQPLARLINHYDADELEGFSDDTLQNNFYGKQHLQAKNVNCAFYSH